MQYCIVYMSSFHLKMLSDSFVLLSRLLLKKSLCDDKNTNFLELFAAKKSVCEKESIHIEALFAGKL